MLTGNGELMGSLGALALVFAAGSTMAAGPNGWLGVGGKGVQGQKWADSRILRKEVVVPASVDTVWKAWTDSEAMKAFFAQESKIELKVGGAYEMYFLPDQPYGDRGAEGCTILAYVPQEMLAFTWNASPAVPTLRAAQARTQVVIQFNAVGPSETKVQLTQLGFGETEDWNAYYDYFDKAWAHVLGNLKDKVKGGAGSPPAPDKTWKGGSVEVRVFSKPVKRQDFVVELPASADRVWSVLATPEGVKSFYPSNPIIELWPGGKYDLHGGKPNRVMAMIPREMLAATGSAPERFPNVMQGGTWGVFYLNPLGKDRTELRLTSVGWRPGEEEWDQAFDYFLKANAQFLNMLHERFTNEK